MAKDRLEGFDEIFFVRSLTPELVRMSDMGWTFLEAKHKKAQSASKQAPRIDILEELRAHHSSTLQWLENANRLDLEVFQHAMGRGRRTKQSGGGRSEASVEPPASSNPSFNLFCSYDAFMDGRIADAARFLHMAASGLHADPTRFVPDALRRFNYEANFSRRSPAAD
jgi:hypothetical protein